MGVMGTMRVCRWIRTYGSLGLGQRAHGQHHDHGSDRDRAHETHGSDGSGNVGRDTSDRLMTMQPLRIPMHFAHIGRGMFRSRSPGQEHLPFLMTLGLRTVLHIGSEMPHRHVATMLAQTGTRFLLASDIFGGVREVTGRYLGRRGE